MGSIFITGGIHGDEPGGAQALAPLREEGFDVYGPCNAWGIENKRRRMQDGRDLNRMFARRDCPQAQAVREAVRAASPNLLLDLHEDLLVTQPYLIQFGPESDIGSRLVDALKSKFEFAPRPRFGPLTGRAGVLRPSRFSLWFVGMSGRWPLGYWFWETFAKAGIVVEAPGAYSLERRIELHLAVARTAKIIVSGQS